MLYSLYAIHLLSGGLMPDTPDRDLVTLLDGMRQRFALIDRQLMGLQADISGYTVAAQRQQTVATPPPARPAPASPACT